MSDNPQPLAYRLDGARTIQKGFVEPVEKALNNFEAYKRENEEFTDSAKRAYREQYESMNRWRKFLSFKVDSDEYYRNKMFSLFCLKPSFVTKFDLTEEQERAFYNSFTSYSSTIGGLRYKLNDIKQKINDGIDLNFMSVYLTDDEVMFTERFVDRKVPDWLKFRFYLSTDNEVVLRKL